jgi:hypothetical protein
MLKETKCHGWLRKKSCSRDTSLDIKQEKKIVIEEKVAVGIKTRRMVKVLNEAKNGFDIIKL